MDPHDEHDYDGINENILLDLPLDGQHPARLLVRPERNGYMYVLDRQTGEVLAADPYGPVNRAIGIDLARPADPIVESREGHREPPGEKCLSGGTGR